MNKKYVFVLQVIKWIEKTTQFLLILYLQHQYRYYLQFFTMLAIIMSIDFNNTATNSKLKYLKKKSTNSIDILNQLLINKEGK